MANSTNVTSANIVSNSIIIKGGTFQEKTTSIFWRVVSTYKEVKSSTNNHIWSAPKSTIIWITCIIWVVVTAKFCYIIKNKTVIYCGIFSIAINSSCSISTWYIYIILHNTIRKGHSSEQSHSGSSISIGKIICDVTILYGKTIPYHIIIFYIIFCIFFTVLSSLIPICICRIITILCFRDGGSMVSWWPSWHTNIWLSQNSTSLNSLRINLTYHPIL